MSERFQGTGSGKGDKSRIADVNKFSRNMEKIYEKKTLQFWCVWEGYDSDKSVFNTKDLKEGEKVSYSEYMSRIIKLHKLQ
jgi:hypothetical protein